MPVNNGRANAELQAQRLKLLSSYSALLEEFSSKDLTSVGNYTLGRLIGKGSFGKVYLARHKLTNGSKVVLKSAKKDDPNLAREIHHHRQFLHPHIARLYEVIVTESLVWLVLEYCPGKMDLSAGSRSDELYTYLSRHGRIEPAKVQKIFTQLVGAVSYVHNKSCVHRDLKLENILLDKHGNVKLCDFGFTREYEGKASYLQTWCGTVCYSAPEMLKGEKYAGEKVDVWSLGIILYALLCGELPFDEEDDAATKAQILKEDPKYPDHLPPPAKDVVVLLLSKRPLLRPPLSDILANPWLAEYAPQQQAILKLQQPAPFTTQLERDTLERMRSAGVDIDQVIENVLAQRCDGLAGWWALLILKEERKEKRREQKRRQKEAEARSLRRYSGNSRMDRLAPTINESDEERLHNPSPRETLRTRGREQVRVNDIAAIPELSAPPDLSLNGIPNTSTPTPPFYTDGARSFSSSRHRPLPPLKERRTSKASVLHIVETNASRPNEAVNSKRKRKYQQPFMNQLASIKHWFKESARRAKSPNLGTRPPLSHGAQRSRSRDNLKKISTVPAKAQHAIAGSQRPELFARATFPQRPRIHTNDSGNSRTSSRPSLSPSPLTPRSSYRRNAGLRERKSTSSTVSSVRSIRHHSKASSTSSASIGSPSASAIGSPSASAIGSPSASATSARPPARSPHSSVKILPTTPSAMILPSNIRVVRAPPSLSFSTSSSSAIPKPEHDGSSRGPLNSAFNLVGPPSPGLSLVFAKRRRSTFKGPSLSAHGLGGRRGSGLDGGGGSRRRSGIIEEEEEDGDGEEEVEEVDAFSPVVGPGEFVEEEPGILDGGAAAGPHGLRDG